MSIATSERFAIGKRVTIVGAAVNTSLAIIKILIGWLGASPALVADGVHSFSDLLCDALVLVASKYGAKDADENHPYGHRRFETFATFLIGLFLTLVAAGIGYAAAESIAKGQLPVPTWVTLIAAGFSLVANEWLYRYTLCQAKKIHSAMLHANAEHSRGDALSSLVVFFGIAGALAGWVFLDAIAAIVVALLIFQMGAKWMARSLYELSDAGLEAAELQEIRNLIIETDGVLHMHQLRTRKMAEQIFLDVHIEIPPYLSASEGHYIAEVVRVKLMKKNQAVTDVTVHVDIENHPEGLPNKMLLSRREILEQFQAKWFELIPPQALKNMVLYYVGYKIEIVLQLDYDWFSCQQVVSFQALEIQLAASVQARKEIRKLSIALVR